MTENINKIHKRIITEFVCQSISRCSTVIYKFQFKLKFLEGSL